jgi:lipopolysaccharide transport system ATP-binding protein
MYVRLAFAVAAHLETDVLIVDEVLAVGDAKFQQRCMSKMQDVSRAGRTVLFVSHNMAAIQRMCSRVVRLDAGRVKDHGSAHEIVARYLAETHSVPSKRAWTDLDSAPGSETVKIASVEVRSLSPEEIGPLSVETGAEVLIEYVNLLPSQHLNLSAHVYSADDVLVLNAIPVDEPDWFGKPFPAGRYQCRFELPPRLLNSGTYRIELLVVRDQAVILSKHENIVAFEVVDAPNGSMWHGRLPGVVRPKIRWVTKRLDQ